MRFKVKARTLLHLGAELISSDAVAFYELIKNAFDAKSIRVDIDVVVRIPHEQMLLHRRLVEGHIATQSKFVNREELATAREAILADISKAAPHADVLMKQVERAGRWDALSEILDGANYIDFVDFGTGMSRTTLDEVFLTIGTRFRLEDRKAVKDKHQHQSTTTPILGEKGLGRLSAMRLGEVLTIKTATEADENWNVLQLDWRKFSHNSEDMLEDIEIPETTPQAKQHPKDHGTQIRIAALSSSWTIEKVQKIAKEEFSRLQDPFERKVGSRRISLRFNDEGISIPTLNKLLFEHAHAEVDAHFAIIKNQVTLSGQINYVQRKRRETFLIETPELLSITGAESPAALFSVGPFSVKIYWYNRQALSAIEGIGDRTAVKNLQALWAGGLMLFRDGFRVHPYGNPDDDWLDLDRKALGSSGFKVNRRQLIGKVDITSRGNPALVDQTNREGLRESDEKQLFVKLLKHVLETRFRGFLNRVDKEVQARIPVSFEDLEERVISEEKRIREGLRELNQKFPHIKKDTHIISIITDSMKRLRTVLEEAKQLAESYEQGHSQLVHLAGLGMMVEILAHELNRTTYHTLSTLASAERKSLSAEISRTFSTLEAQLKTLQKRLRVLDPLSIPGRQVKENFDLIAWVEEILASHEPQLRRHHISALVEVVPSKPAKAFPVRMVKGMIVQVMENLLSNSIYWIKQERKINPRLKARITVTIDIEERTVSVTDNGPGVPNSDQEIIFQPFVTSKPPGEGKGLGLYISREIATYHGATLTLSPTESIHKGRLNTFILNLGTEQK